ncbi:Oidioi.mRNA.OKI2018_I69.chr2.g5412.t1.cds [Oikopleura dioica]|uniref:Oidioi.mRNA.OKI2018_I69.chr2.g5412.t1.cds n=1 Tax=Oikopleura dioica TaxID=34765 RepID=A0ABN7T0S2_OIKDI|nr:Oidioi.mRNA.OKI2018_I69.chr2.g5412.t1.cds [Oikopleura dioica]
MLPPLKTGNLKKEEKAIDLLEKTKFVKFLSEEEAILQLRYLHWILKGVLRIYEDYIVDAKRPPSVLFQAEKTFCEFPNEFRSNSSWDRFMASRQQSRRQQQVTTSKSGLRPKEIAQLMEEADKWELNQETVFCEHLKQALEALVKSRVARVRQKQEILGDYRKKKKSNEMFFIMRNKNRKTEVILAERARRDPLTNWSKILRKRFSHEESVIFRHELNPLDSIRLPLLSAKLKLCFMIFVSEIDDLHSRNPNMMAAILQRYIKDMLKITDKTSPESLLPERSNFRRTLFFGSKICRTMI